MRVINIKIILLPILFMMSILFAPAQPNNQITQIKNDVKIQQRFTAGGQTFGQTRYIKGSRERVEYEMQGMFTTITQCDKRRTIKINDETRTYLIEPMDGYAGAPSGQQPQQVVNPTQTVRGGVITYTQNRFDTKERKEMFGFIARHIKTTITMDASPDACSQTKQRMEQDGWYIDLNLNFSCEFAARPKSMKAGRECVDEIRSKVTGVVGYNFPLDETTTIYQEDGTKFITRTEVLEFSREQLDPALFDIPAGYREVKNVMELMGVENPDSPEQGEINGIKTSSKQPVTDKNKGTTSQQINTGPKKIGAIRLGVVMPKVQTPGEMDASEAVRAILIQNLSGRGVEITTINASVQPEIDAEAARKECDFVLYTDVTHKRGGGRFGGIFGKVAGDVAGVVVNPGRTTPSVILTTAAAISILTGNVKSKDEVTLEYRLFSSANKTSILSNKLKAKASSDGEDVFSKLIEQEADAVISVLQVKIQR